MRQGEVAEMARASRLSAGTSSEVRYVRATTVTRSIIVVLVRVWARRSSRLAQGRVLGCRRQCDQQCGADTTPCPPRAPGCGRSGRIRLRRRHTPERQPIDRVRQPLDKFAGAGRGVSPTRRVRGRRGAMNDPPSARVRRLIDLRRASTIGPTRAPPTAPRLGAALLASVTNLSTGPTTRTEGAHARTPSAAVAEVTGVVGNAS